MCLKWILVFAVLGLTATPSYAEPVQVTVESKPFTVWEFAQKDSGGMTTSIIVADSDGDGIASFVTDGPFEGVAMGDGSVRFVSVGFNDFPLPCVQSDDLSLIVELFGPPSGIFSLGQSLAVINGTVAGLDGLVHENPGISTALGVLTIDVSSLPVFTGEAMVTGLLSVEVIPEPSTFVLAALGLVAMIFWGRQR